MERVFTNARVVLADQVVAGTVLVRDGVIADVSTGRSDAAPAEDLEGDLLIPGLVELHTDALEGHMMPRPGAEWPAIPAVVAHDNQVAAAGITTVLDAIALGAVSDNAVRIRRAKETVTSLGEAQQAGLLRAEHMLHLRCEVTYPDLPALFESLADTPLLRLVSLMDHTPGQRQFVDEDLYRFYYQAKFKLNDAEMDAFIADRRKDQEQYGDRHRRHIVEVCQARGVVIASHDDATAAHVDEAVENGVAIAEFPTTVEAARASHDNGLRVMMGGPNVVRGGSHSGNVSARALAEAGLLDILSSDYAPASLLHAAFLLAEEIDGIELPVAVQTVTKAAADGAGLTDRGEIAPGRRADLVRVHHSPHHPVVRGVWREGRRVA